MLMPVALVVLSLAVPSPELVRFRVAAYPPGGSPDLSGSVAGLEPGPRARQVLWFERLPDAAMRARLEALGVTVLAWLPDRAVIATVPAAARVALTGGGDVRLLGPLAPGLKIAPELLDGGHDAVQLQLFADADVGAVVPVIAAVVAPARVELSSVAVSGAIVHIDGTEPFSAQQMGRLAALDDVEMVEPAFRPVPLNDDSIWVGQSYDTVNRRAYDQSATVWSQGLTGTGEIVAALDTGLDSDACQFKLDPGGVTDAEPLDPPGLGGLFPDRKVIAYYVKPGFDPYGGAGHGTVVAGCILGDDFGTLSTPLSHGHDPGDGMAPNARLVMQVPLSYAGDLAGAIEQARAAGARIHNNSWKGGGNTYSGRARQLDDTSWRLDDLLVVFAAGNDGGGFDGASVTTPGLAKNTLMVGATSHGTDNDARNLADFSSRGPTFDGRRKPDVVIPGRGIVSAASDGNHTSNNCAPTGGGSGTSFAAPTASGLAALVRQYYRDGFHPTGAGRIDDGRLASSALIKATLINGARPLDGIDTGTSAPVDPIPSFNQGWGRILLDDVLRFVGDDHSLRVVDRSNPAGLETGAVDVVHVGAEPSHKLEVTLVWTDPAATSLAASMLVNDLDLVVIAPDTTRYLGNVFSGGESTTGGVRDDRNNVEAVALSTPQSGSYEIRVEAAAVPGNGVPLSFRQGYALVVTSAPCPTTPATPTAPTLADRGAAGVRVAWTATPGATEHTVVRAPGGCGAAPGEFAAVGVTVLEQLDDGTVLPGVTYGYRLRAAAACGESELGPCSEVAPAGRCVVPPTFSGAVSATSDGSTCAVTVSWEAAIGNCPIQPGVRYNVYRSDAADFVPAASTLLASGVAGVSYLDGTATAGRTWFYVVRAEDYAVGSGPNGGNEDGNRRQTSATPRGGFPSVTNLVDDGGDTWSWLTAEPDWSYSALENATPSGRLSYRSSLRDDWTYGAGVCSTLTSVPIELAVGGAPVMTYATRYNVEDEWDGVIVEISIDGGASWMDLPPQPDYPGDLSQTGTPPINACGDSPSQGAFSGPPGNAGLTPWTTWTTLLAPWAGQTIQIRFRLTTDGGAEFDGFYLDDITITEAWVQGDCEACLAPSTIGNTLRAVRRTDDVHLIWIDAADAVSHVAQVSTERDFSTLERTLPAGNGPTGVSDPGVVPTPPRLLLYRVRGVGNCGQQGP